MAAKPVVALDIWSDLACPWWCDSQERLCDGKYSERCVMKNEARCMCSYVGKRRLDKALELNKERANFRIQWWGWQTTSLTFMVSRKDGSLSADPW